ncbi:MAG: RNA polymerase sigma factor [Alphaproteobacteria bacterium]|nr:RNA polymerase sigma factor [Alphaproteobacteria bacterium]
MTAPTDAERTYLRRFVGRMVGDGALAEDLVQETLLKAHRHGDAFAGRARRTTWLAAIALNVVRDHFRKPAEPLVAADPAVVEAIPACDDTERALLEREMGACITGYLMALPERQQAVLALHDMAGLGHAEIAAQLGVAEGNARVLLSRARAALRASLAANCRLAFGTDAIPCARHDAAPTSSAPTSSVGAAPSRSAPGIGGR